MENANPSCSTSNREFLDPKKKKEIESWLGDSRIVDLFDGSNEIEYFDTFPTLEELEYHEWLLKYPKPSWWKNPTSTILDQTIANLKTQLVENEVVRVKIPKCMAWLDDEHVGDLNTIEDKVDNPSLQVKFNEKKLGSS
ncbi:hypothetical protein Tco_0497048 [Tanacetum coccineum]